VNIEGLPAELRSDAIHILSGAKANVFPKESVEQLWAWLQDDGYGIIVDAYDDWIVADMNSLSEQWFNDEEMRTHMFAPLEYDDDPIDDTTRLAFSRRLLCEHPDGRPVEEEGETDSLFDNPAYPPVVTLELTDSEDLAYFGVLVFPQGQLGPRFELIAVFAQIADGKKALRDQGYVTLFGSEEERLSDEAIPAYWNRR
jgi:hypothetical protein